MNKIKNIFCTHLSARYICGLSLKIITLPLIYALKHGTSAQQQILREAITQGGKELINDVIAAIKSTNAIEYTAQAARREAQKAIEALTGFPASPYTDALLTLADFSVNRNF